METQAGLQRLAVVSGKTFAQRTAPAPDAAEWKGGATAATHEVYAYVAVRDVLLAEAEEQPASATIDSVSIANELVETFLRPARPPYEVQSLPENEAVPQRQRCQAVRVRLAQLRSQLARAHQESNRAA